MNRLPIRYFKTSPVITHLTVMMDVEFGLPLRNVEGLLHERGIDVCTREGEALAWLANGKSHKGIAKILDLRPRTVTRPIEQICTELGVRNRTTATAIVSSQLTA